MAEDGASAEQGSEQQQEGGNTSGFTPPATQQELNRIISERVKRTEAKFADYETLRAQAAEFAKLQEASKSEAEKVAERLSAADAAVAKVPQLVAEQLRAALIDMHSISDEDAELFLTASDPVLLRRQADRLVAQRADAETRTKKQGNHVPREGTQTTATESEERETARGLFGG